MTLDVSTYTTEELLAELKRRETPLFKTGDLAVDTAYWHGVVRINRPTTHPEDFPNHYHATRIMDGCAGLYDAAQLRRATDAEVATYHLAHCQQAAPTVAREVAENTNVMGGRIVRGPRSGGVAYRLLDAESARMHQAGYSAMPGRKNTYMWAMDDTGRIVGSTDWVVMP